MTANHHFEAPVLNSIKRTCDRLDIGKTTVFKLITEGQLRTIKIGTKTLVTEASIQRLIAKDEMIG